MTSLTKTTTFICILMILAAISPVNAQVLRLKPGGGLPVPSASYDTVDIDFSVTEPMDAVPASWQSALDAAASAPVDSSQKLSFRVPAAVDLWRDNFGLTETELAERLTSALAGKYALPNTNLRGSAGGARMNLLPGSDDLLYLPLSPFAPADLSGRLGAPEHGLDGLVLAQGSFAAPEPGPTALCIALLLSLVAARKRALSRRRISASPIKSC